MTYDPSVDIAVLKAEVRRLKARIALRNNGAPAAAASPWPARDFVVDMFDRANSSTLGGYWLETVFSSNSLWPPSGNGATARVYNNRALPYAASGFFNSWSEVGWGWQDQVKWARTSQRTGAYLGYNVYRAAMRSTEGLNLKVLFDGPPSLVPVTGDGSTGYTCGVSSFGVSLGFLMIGGYVTRTRSGSVLMLWAGPTPSFAYDSNYSLFSSFTKIATGEPDFTSSNGGVISTEATSFYGLIHSYVSIPISSGTNELKVTYSSGVLTILVNGVSVYSGVHPGVFGLVEQVGVCYLDTDTAANGSSYGGEYRGVSAFKAWVGGMSEPGNESGHGAKNTGTGPALLYADKYHTPTLDSFGALIGHTYNPSA